MADLTMKELLKKYGSKAKGFTKGQKVDAKIIEISKKSVLFDVGGKAEGILKDVYFQEARDFMKTLKVGDTVSALVMEPENREGNVVLSLRHAASDSLWEKLENLKKKGTVLQVVVKTSNQSGVSVEYEGLNSFIPASQLSKDKQKHVDNIVGALRVKVIEVDKARKKVILSEKAVSEEKEIKEIEDAITKIKTGEIYDGIVTTVTNFGIFVEIKAGKSKNQPAGRQVEGLAHISEISWEKSTKPADLFEIGDKVKVKVIGVNDGKLSLSVKAAQDDPWQNIEKKFKVEDKVKGKIVRNSDFGTFVALDKGIEGLIHITKIPPAMKFNVGDEVNVLIEEIDTKNKKIALGLVLSAKPLGYK